MHVVRGELPVKDGILTLYDTLFQKIYTGVTRWQYIFRLQLGSTAWHADFQVELFPLHSPLLGESLLVSFPPLINMLKFSG
jgi:hypothetical protein